MNSGRVLAGGSNLTLTSTDPYIDVEKFIARLADKEAHLDLQLEAIKRMRYSKSINKSLEDCVLIDNG